MNNANPTKPSNCPSHPDECEYGVEFDGPPEACEISVTATWLDDDETEHEATYKEVAELDGDFLPGEVEEAIEQGEMRREAFILLMDKLQAS